MVRNKVKQVTSTVSKKPTASKKSTASKESTASNDSIANRTRSPLAMKPANDGMPLASSADNVQSSSTTISIDMNRVSSPISEPSASTTSAVQLCAPTSFSTLKNRSLSPTPRSSEENKSSSNSMKSKKRSREFKSSKSFSHTQLIKPQQLQEDSDAETEYNLTTCINESGGIDKFLSTPCMILYKCNLTSQG